jgi:hypothetical protein
MATSTRVVLGSLSVVVVVLLATTLALSNQLRDYETADVYRLAEFANGVADGMRGALEEVEKDEVNWYRVYAGLSRAGANAKAAGLLVGMLPDDKREFAWSLSGLGAELDYYALKALRKGDGEVSDWDEQRLQKFVQVLVTMRVFSAELNGGNDSGWASYQGWAEHFYDALLATETPSP